jgi:hypothetical protein
MNRKEWVETRQHTTAELKYVQSLLKQWKIDNNLTCRCCVHHRDDNDEVRAYNEAHYELWGFNEDGTFEYGKYVVFMTNVEHSSYHNKGKPAWNKGLSLPNQSGENHPMYGKHHSEESKRRISNTLKGRKLPQETKDKMSEAHKGRIRSDDHCKHLSDALRTLGIYYKQYKACGSALSWNEFKHALKIGEIKYTDFI